ncbi:MAG: NAD(P)-binding protein [Negativicutes bacterium]|nr:NAD(P)-binding protein [Negativicutes bacterium]
MNRRQWRQAVVCGIDFPFDRPLTDKRRLADRLGWPAESIGDWAVVRQSLDARGDRRPRYVYNVAVRAPAGLFERLPAGLRVTGVPPGDSQPLTAGDQPLAEPPVVVGAGPAGLLAGWLLAEHGFRPLIVERGLPVGERTAIVQHFWQSGQLDPECNVQFGEGGAGAFSDGKLTARSLGDERSAIIKILTAAGAPPEIAWLARPHIGSDRLPAVVSNLRRRIEQFGGRYLFGTRLDDIIAADGRLQAVVLNGCRQPCQVCLLATGHSARDLYFRLAGRRVAMAVKPLAVGVRIEHSQRFINRCQYRSWADHNQLPPADYSLTWQDQLSGRGVYAFCMCPGGQVIAAASEPGRLVVNGMSNYRRDGCLANSALVVTVVPEDCGGHPLAAIEWLRQWEGAAFRAGGGGYCAPVQAAAEFVGQPASRLPVEPSYRPGWRRADLRACLPGQVVGPLQRALVEFDRRLPGFVAGGVLTAIESRTSSPVRLLRREDRQSLSHGGLYPVGEGAGYAGGIMSAAVDGYRSAGMIISRYRPAY